MRMRPACAQDCVRRHHDLDAAFADVGGGLHDVAVGHLGQVEAGGLHEIVERHLADARHRRHVELAGLGAGARHELGDRCDLRRRRHADRHDGVGHPRDRQQVARRIGQLLVLERMHRERAAGREQQRMVVVAGDERLDRHQAVGAGPVFDHHRLAPARRQPVGQHARADIGAGARPERHDEPHRPLRPRLRLRLRRQRYGNREESEGKRAQLRHGHEISGT
jgi:hypothetical protein